MKNTTTLIDREEEIANCLESGRTTTDIEKEYAVKWNVSRRTIARYIKAVKGKKNGQDTTEILSDPEIEAKLSAIVAGKLKAEKPIHTREGIIRLKCLPSHHDICDAALTLAQIRDKRAKREKNSKNLNGNK